MGQADWWRRRARKRRRPRRLCRGEWRERWRTRAHHLRRLHCSEANTKSVRLDACDQEARSGERFAQELLNSAALEPANERGANERGQEEAAGWLTTVVLQRKLPKLAGRQHLALTVVPALVLLTLTLLTSCRLSSANSDANRLYEDLMMTYNRIVRPVQNNSDRVVVRLGLKLSQLMDVEWSDYKLKWDPSEYGGIKDINLPAEQIWLPDIALYNSAEGFFSVSIMTKAKVRYDGHVIWNPPAIFRSSCQIDITYFPFDSQNCHLKFGSWTFGTKLDLRHINDTEGTIERGTDLSEYYQNVEWDIMQATARRNVITYICCPNDYYPDVTFNFTLRRKPLFYTVNLILPCIGITFFSFLVFYLPSDSGEKVTLTISILVSLIFFLSVLIETIPSTSLAMPLLGKYIVFTLILITLSVCATVCVLNIHFRTPSTHSMPHWIKRWCMDILPRYLLMSVPQYQSQSENILPEQLIYMHNQAYASQLAATTKFAEAAAHKAAPAGAEQAARASRRPSEQAELVQALKQQQQQQVTIGKLSNRQQAAQVSLASTNKALAAATSVPKRQQQQKRASSALSTRHKPETVINQAMELEHSVVLSNSASFLPYLQSEAARRLQMQRSRSSERDKSTSGEQANDLAAGKQQSVSSNAAKQQQQQLDNHNLHSMLNLSAGELERQARTSRRPLDKSRTSSSGIWGLFKRSANREQQRQQQQQKERQRPHSPSRTLLSTNAQLTPDAGQQAPVPLVNARHRPSTVSNASSSQQLQQQSEPDDEYQHHRHFQARASICSNNLWRIGPTRRCSLAVPANNYPSYYRPLAQLQAAGGAYQRRQQKQPNQLATISGAMQPPLHYHIHGDQSAEQSSASSTSSSGAQMALGNLITAAASNLLVRPKESLRAQRDSIAGPITSLAGFIENQAPRSVGAIPPQRRELDCDDSTSTTTSGRAEQLAPPPPPPPLPPEFCGPGELFGAGQQQQQQLACSNAISAHSKHYRASNMHKQQQQQHLMQQETYSPALRTAPSVRQLAHATVRQQQLYLHAGAQFAAMPRSKSTDQRMAHGTNNNDHALVAANSAAGVAQFHTPSYALLAPQQNPLCAQVRLLPASGHHQSRSIGRALGQAYVQQRFQRQSGVCSPFGSRQLAANTNRQQSHFEQEFESTELEAMKVLRARQQQSLFDPNNLTQHKQQQQHHHHQHHSMTSSVIPNSIDMLRRSKSQTSLLGRQLRQHQFEQVPPNRGANYFDEPKTLRTASNLGTLHRAQSDMRARSQAPADCRYGAAVECGCNSRAFLNAPSPMPGYDQRPGNNNNNNCSCTATRDDAPMDDRMQLVQKQQQQASKQLSTLSLLKLINEVDKAIQNAMFIAQHIDNLDEFESVKENWKYIAMVIDRIFLLIFLFACIVGTVAIFALVPWSHYLIEKPIDLQMTRLLALNLTSGESLSRGCHDF